METNSPGPLISSMVLLTPGSSRMRISTAKENLHSLAERSSMGGGIREGLRDAHELFMSMGTSTSARHYK